MSDSLQAYFLLENVGLSRDDRRQILPANQSNYSVEGIEKALRVSFYDIHDRERGAGHREQAGGKRSGKGFRKHYAHVAQGESDGSGHKDEDDAAEDDAAYAIVAGEGETHEGTGGSDIGASEDDEIYDAFSAYQESRRKLKDFQKSWFPSQQGSSPEERKQAIRKEKSRTRCAATGPAMWKRLARALADRAQGAEARAVPRKECDKGEARERRSMSMRTPASSPCRMATPTATAIWFEKVARQTWSRTMASEAEEEDQGLPHEREWEVMSEIPPPYVGEASAAEMPMPMPDRTQPDAEDVGPRDLRTSGPGQCDRWEAAVSGAKAQLIERLQKLYRGELVHKKGCSKKMVRLEEHKGSLIPLGARRSAEHAATSRRLCPGRRLPLRRQLRRPQPQRLCRRRRLPFRRRLNSASSGPMTAAPRPAVYFEAWVRTRRRRCPRPRWLAATRARVPWTHARAWRFLRSWLLEKWLPKLAAWCVSALWFCGRAAARQDIFSAARILPQRSTANSPLSWVKAWLCTAIQAARGDAEEQQRLSPHRSCALPGAMGGCTAQRIQSMSPMLETQPCLLHRSLLKNSFSLKMVTQRRLRRMSAGFVSLTPPVPPAYTVGSGDSALKPCCQRTKEGSPLCKSKALILPMGTARKRTSRFGGCQSSSPTSLRKCTRLSFPTERHRSYSPFRL